MQIDHMIGMIMRHNNGVVIAALAGGNFSRFQKAFAITDFYRGARDSRLPLGTIQLMGKPDASTLRDAVGDHLPGVRPEELWRHTVDFFITAEDLALPENRVQLAPDGRIRLVLRETNLEAYERLRLKLVESLEAIGRRNPSLRPIAVGGFKLGIGGVSHQCGTLRFGNDPGTSVLDAHCRAHDVDNLYVVDASFFPSSGAVNPSLTIMANALRVGDAILRRIGASGSRADEASLTSAVT
jgi:choline dehydrogenase-like flavoprotein